MRTEWRQNGYTLKHKGFEVDEREDFLLLRDVFKIRRRNIGFGRRGWAGQFLRPIRPPEGVGPTITPIPSTPHVQRPGWRHQPVPHAHSASPRSATVWEPDQDTGQQEVWWKCKATQPVSAMASWLGVLLFGFYHRTPRLTMPREFRYLHQQSSSCET